MTHEAKMQLEGYNRAVAHYQYRVRLNVLSVWSGAARMMALKMGKELAVLKMLSFLGAKQTTACWLAWRHFIAWRHKKHEVRPTYVSAVMHCDEF